MEQCELHRHTYTHAFNTCMHACSVEAESCARTGEDEVLSALTVLDRNLWMRIEEMQCVSRRHTCSMSVEPLVILAYYNIEGHLT